jgi:isoleucyl-tRNA synthetase
MAAVEKGVFEPVSTKVSFPELEQRLLKLWTDERIYERSVEEAKERPRFVFYEGPPAAAAGTPTACRSRSK